VEHEGTFPLPEAQLDRFLLRLSIGYPDVDTELEILDDHRAGSPLSTLQPVVSLADLTELTAAIDLVHMDDLIRRWIVELVQATRQLDMVALSASVRATLALDRCTRAAALLDSRDYVTPVDVERLFEAVVGHRVTFSPAFVSELFTHGREEVFSRFWAACLEVAPPPA
jgi:MoxR-like ATPase